jgi:hypothetical protein
MKDVIIKQQNLIDDLTKQGEDIWEKRQSLVHSLRERGMTREQQSKLLYATNLEDFVRAIGSENYNEAKQIYDYEMRYNDIDDEIRRAKTGLEDIKSGFDFPQQQQKHGQPTNTLAHIRLTDRNIDGRKVLFVEEIQSDWHQAAQKKVKRTLPSGEVVEEKVGYKNKQQLEKMQNEIDKLQDEYDALDFEFRKTENQEVARKRKEKLDELNKLMSLRYTYEDAPAQAPFSNTSEWSELALKKVLQEAVDGGYDEVALVTGQQAVDVVGGKASGMQGFYDLVTPSGKTGVLPATLKDYAKKLGVKLEMEQSNILGTKPEQAKQLADYRLGQLSGQTQGQVLPPSYVPDFIDAIPAAIEAARNVPNAGAEFVINKSLDAIGQNTIFRYNRPIFDNLVELYRPAIEGALSGNMNAYNNIVFKITPDVKSAVGKGQRLWSAGAGIGPAMELLRQRQGLPPKKEEKKKK